jgi:hypothetical protein
MVDAFKARGQGERGVPADNRQRTPLGQESSPGPNFDRDRRGAYSLGRIWSDLNLFKRFRSGF